VSRNATEASWNGRERPENAVKLIWDPSLNTMISGAAAGGTVYIGVAGGGQMAHPLSTQLK